MPRANGNRKQEDLAAFVRELVARGFAAPQGLLVMLDGAKGPRAAVRDVFGDDVPVQRCQWHKRENELSYLPKSRHAEWRRKLQQAYAQGGHADAIRALQRLVAELTILKESAARSLAEGLEDTLTVHRLGLHEELRRSFNTTNLIESFMAQIERKTQRVDHWRNGNQKQRWCSATLLQVEKNFRRVRGFKQLPLLQVSLSHTLHATAARAAYSGILPNFN